MLKITILAHLLAFQVFYVKKDSVIEKASNSQSFIEKQLPLGNMAITWIPILPIIDTKLVVSIINLKNGSQRTSRQRRKTPVKCRSPAIA